MMMMMVVVVVVAKNDLSRARSRQQTTERSVLSPTTRILYTSKTCFARQ